MTCTPTPCPTTDTPRQLFIDALERRPARGRIPHFELVFFLTMEAFGRVHFSQRAYRQWDQMQPLERELHLQDQADLYVAIAERYDWNAMLLHPNPTGLDETVRLIDLIREKSGDRYFLMLHGDATFSIPNGRTMTDFVYRLADEPEKVHEEAARRVADMLHLAEQLKDRCKLDGFALCSDYCFNSGPFLSPGQFGEFVTPYLAKLIAGYRDMGYYVIKHTDGNIMPILDQLVEANPHALHSLDPQGGIDIAEIKKLCGHRVALCGNVNCALMDTGTDQEVIASARYALQHGSPGGGYIFCTSNCIYTGMPLRRYELILDVWRKWGG